MIFSEDSRVKIPCIQHLVRLGYRHLSLKNAAWDEETNIFPELFRAAIARINPGMDSGDIDRLLADVKLLLDNEDLGKAFYERLGLQNSPAKLLPKGTVILSIVRHLRASILGIEAATNQSVVGIVETDKLKHSFIHPYLVREIPRLMALRTGAQQPHINKGVLDESLLVIPDDATLSAYTSKAAPLFLQIQNNLQQNQQLAQLRDWLLPLLMNGQVTVK